MLRKLIWCYCALAVMTLGVATLVAANLPAGLAGYDTNKDGVLDLKESKAAAGLLFDKLDTHKTGKLDMKALQGRLSEKDFKLADKDADGTLTKDEFIAAVERAYKAADVDNDDVLDAGDLKSKPGQAFLKLVQ